MEIIILQGLKIIFVLNVHNDHKIYDQISIVIDINKTDTYYILMHVCMHVIASTVAMK